MSPGPPYTVSDGMAIPTMRGLALLCGITPEQLQAELDRLTAIDAGPEEFPDLWVHRAANTLIRTLRTHGAAGLLPAVLDQLAAEHTSHPTNP